MGDWQPLTEVQSDSRGGVIHKIDRHTATGRLRCSCEAFRYPKRGQPRDCRHVRFIAASLPQETTALQTAAWNTVGRMMAAAGLICTSTQWKAMADVLLDGKEGFVPPAGHTLARYTEGEGLRPIRFSIEDD